MYVSHIFPLFTNAVRYDDNDIKWYGLGEKIGYRLRPEGETGWPEGSKAARAMSSPNRNRSHENRYGSDANRSATYTRYY